MLECIRSFHLAHRQTALLAFRALTNPSTAGQTVYRWTLHAPLALLLAAHGAGQLLPDPRSG